MPIGVAGAVALGGAALSAGAGIYEQGQQSKANQAAIAPLQQANSTAYSDAEQIASTPYTAYTGQQVAPITGGQQQAVTQAQQVAAQGQAQTDNANATALTSGVANNGWNANTAATYMNPYTQQVTDEAQKALNQSYANVQNTAALNAASSGAFGGDRAAITQATNAGEYELQSGTLEAQNQANAYNSAIQTWQADNNRALNAAQSYEAAGNDLTQMNSQQIKDLLATGGVAQATQQMQLNANYNDYLDQRSWANTELQPLLQATGSKGTPAAAQMPNTASDLVGIGSALAGYFGSNYGGSGGYSQGTTDAMNNNALNQVNNNFGGYNAGLTSDVGNIQAPGG